METLEWPLRVGPDGRLARAGDPWDPLLEIIRAMAASPPSSWSHAPWFGLEEVFRKAKRNVEEQPDVARALNQALEQLGIGWARVDAVFLDVEAVRSRPHDPPRFSIRFATPNGTVHRSLSL